MRRLLWIVFSFVIVTAQPASAAPKAQYLIKFKLPIGAMEAEKRLGEAGFSFKRLISEIDVYVATVEGDEAKAVDTLKRVSKLAYIEKDEARWKIVGATTPNDPLFAQQYALKQVEAEAAWDTTVGSRDIVVAVSDTGVDLTHPDLANQIWVNTKEIPGNGKDDDGNGFVDDVNGWDFSANDNNPNDENGHGTHCAGIIGAEGNNAVGTVGANWRVRIMPVRFLGANGSGSTSGGVDTILYAANNGARIVSASWGSSQGSSALRDAIDYAFAHGTIVVAAAGNESADTDTRGFYPALYAHVSVAASGQGSTLASFSNYGRTNVDLAAPGVNIMSTYMGGGWKSLSGTSMATPLVSGIAALMLSENPELTALELRNATLNAVVARPAFATKTSTGGEINARLAIEQLLGTLQAWPASLTLAVGAKFTLSGYAASGAIRWSASDTSIASIAADGTLTALKPGPVTITARDASGSMATSNVQIIKLTGGRPGR